MLNGEKFKKEIEDVDCELAKCNGKIVRCCDTNCVTCDFYDKEQDCRIIIVKWLLEEYKDLILDDKGKDYIKTLVSPFRVDDIVTIVKNNIDNELRYELRYELIVDLVHGQMYVYFDRESMLGEIFAKMKSNYSYNAKELGLC